MRSMSAQPWLALVVSCMALHCFFLGDGDFFQTAFIRGRLRLPRPPGSLVFCLRFPSSSWVLVFACAFCFPTALFPIPKKKTVFEPCPTPERRRATPSSAILLTTFAPARSGFSGQARNPRTGRELPQPGGGWVFS